MTDIQKEEKERAEFEAWFSDNGVWPKSLERSGDGYLLMAAQSAWRVWQAARRSQPEGWISVAEKLPELICHRFSWKESKKVVVLMKRHAEEPYEAFAKLTDMTERWQVEGHNGRWSQFVTHWMPTPALPIAAAPDGREG